MIYLLGLVGKKKSGKDTFCKILQGFSAARIISLPVLRLAFADQVKDELCLELGVSREHLEKYKEKFRPLIKDKGMEGRKKDPKYWINIVDKLIEEYENSKKICVCVITDVRFVNEAEYVKSLGGKTVRIRREDIKEDTEDTHISETELEQIQCDYAVYNYGVWKRFEMEAKLIVETLNIP